MKTIDLTCNFCNKIFTVRAIYVKYGKVKYCSKQCQVMARTKKIEALCLICGKTFFTQPHRVLSNRGKYCSRDCQRKSMERNPEKVCQNCGKTFTKRINKMFCSAECRGLFYKGKNHPRYDPQRPITDYGGNWITQKNLALKRDGYKCSFCGKTKQELPKRTLHVHHRVKRKFFQSEVEANDLNNLVTLCVACHRKAENGRIVV